MQFYKSCYISLPIHILHQVISGCFQHCRKSFGTENLMQIVKLFPPCKMKHLPENRFFTCFEKLVELWDRCMLSEGWYFEKEWYSFCCKYISCFFMILLSDLMVSLQYIHFNDRDVVIYIILLIIKMS